MLGKAHLGGGEGEAVARDMVLRDTVPAAMFYRDPGFLANRFKADIDMGELAGRKGGLAP